MAGVLSIYLSIYRNQTLGERAEPLQVHIETTEKTFFFPLKHRARLNKVGIMFGNGLRKAVV